MLTIQDVDPVRIIHELISESSGTYIVRNSTPNDDIITEIEVNQNENSSISLRPYVVLSIRVDESLYKRKIMNYRLPLTEDLSHLLEPYNRLENNSHFTPLTDEFHVDTQNTNWEIVSNISRKRSYLPLYKCGNSNVRGSIETWKYPNGNKITVFIKNQENKQQFDHEFDILKELCFCHIVELYGYYSNSDLNCLSIVMIDGGKSLISYCPLPEERALNCGFQIANGLVYLEKKKIIHRDLVAANVLIDDYGNVRIADFGHAIKKESDQENSLPTEDDLKLDFRLEICAPECMPMPPENGQTETDSKLEALHEEFSFKSDIWAFGLLLAQLMTDKLSKFYLNCKDDCELIQYIKIDRQIINKPAQCSIDMYNILEKCWIYRPDHRISSLDVRKELLNLMKTSACT